VAAKVRLGDGFDPASDLGPVNNLPQLERVTALTHDARERGGEVMCGGARLDRSGYFFPPTIVCSVPKDAPLVTEEQFGPVLPVLKFDDLNEAIAEANRSEYALGGSVWTQDETASAMVVNSLDCGTCWINWHGPVFHGYPFGGRKHSGFGYEHGWLGLLSYCSPKVVNRFKRAS
jgi:acyl-CoA reductase-like NAD-dependent aldehyde dehydrogenase